jgi:hypothetical protein
VQSLAGSAERAVYHESGGVTPDETRDRAISATGQAVSEGRHAYVLVNNRSEGNAPLEVQGLVEMLEKLR